MATDRQSLRRRRRRYAISARRRRLLGGLALPAFIELPSGRRLERYAHLFWRVRLPLWVVLGTAGWLIVGWFGMGAGLAGAILVEVVFSYRQFDGTTA
jgi:hypothetical protein